MTTVRGVVLVDKVVQNCYNPLMVMTGHHEFAHRNAVL